MTREEYLHYYKRSRSRIQKLTQSAMRGIHRAYIDASKGVEQYIRTSSASGLANPASDAFKGFQKRLQRAADKIHAELLESTPKTVVTVLEETSSIHAGYLKDALDVSGSSFSTGVIDDLYISVNEAVVRDLVSRIDQRGYNFSRRIWDSANNYKENINRVVSSGVAQNRDVIKIAKDISVYTRDGRTKLVKRYGPLKRGTRRFAARIPDSVDYRALRLVRSELYMSLQNASVEQGKANCGSDGLYDWILTGGGQHSCDCEDIARNSPYAENRIPAYPHPNCRCTVRARLRDTKKFVADLKRWTDGESVDYIDAWSKKYFGGLA